MSNKNKKKKAKKQMNPQVMQDVLLGFKTLISNDACITTAREWKGVVKNIIPVGLALGAVVLALVPYFVQQNQVQGSTAVLGTPSSNYEVGLSSMVHSLAYDENNTVRATPITLEIDDQGKLVFDDTGSNFRNAGTSTQTWYQLTRKEENSSGALTDHIVFEAFFNTEAINDNEFFARVDTNQNPYTAETRATQVGTDATVYQSSYIAFGTESVRFRRRNETTTVVGLTGTYELLKNYDLTELATVTLKEVDYNTSEYIDTVKNYFKTFVNNSYEPSKQRSLWMYTGIFFAVDAGAILLFGAMLFLMTRGKKNPYRVYTFWQTQKMAYWASFTPGVLSLIGFAIPNMAFIMFFFLFGFRMMWMSMKSLRPVA